ncbi:MAG: hypothetical protein GC161_18065 [Planctomycetaceae bacterium]|nr:hypothetical protein [Planctomycetaceae bacterium]
MRSRLLIVPVALGATLLAIFLQLPRDKRGAEVSAAGQGEESAENLQRTEGEGVFPGWAGVRDGTTGGEDLSQSPSDLPAAEPAVPAPAEPAVEPVTPSVAAIPADGAPATDPANPVGEPAADVAAAPSATPASDTLPAADAANPAAAEPAAQAPAVDAPPAARLANLRVRVSEADGSPVPGVWVALARDGDSTAVSEPRTSDADGRAMFTELEPARYEAQLLSPGLRLGPDRFALHDVGASAELLLGPGETRELSLVAPPRARASGSVAVAGAALVDARVTLVDTLTAARTGEPTASGIRIETRAGAGGAFEFPPVPPGAYRLQVRHPNLVEPLDRAVDLPEGASQHVLGFEPGEVAGRITDGAGKPVAGARIWLAGPGRPNCVGFDGDRYLLELVRGAPPEARPAGAFLAATTGGDGFYLIRDVPPGKSLELVCEAPLSAPRRVPVEVGAATTRRLDLSLERGASLDVVLVDRDGAAVAGAWLGLRDPGGALRLARTDGGGRCRWPSLPAGPSQLEAVEYGPSLPDRQIDLVPGEFAELVVALP